ncbi:patched domain-containing protein 3-like [Mizuhopecten yessoensis]|uniref:patched domain-containing protein 3-like n=1 Tax=Mizuhopecten yessoensis TaxID=6573 RepID=UPI000B45C515|nr:patched domain-containing protein 3-like [Mizuhopecten yessoensis]
MVCWSVYARVEKAIGKVFARYGEFVGTYPWIFLTVSVLVCCLLRIGLINLKSETDVEKVYTPMDSQASKDRSTIRTLFSDYSGTNFYSQNLIERNLHGSVIFKSKTSSNLLSLTNIQEIKTFHDQIKANVFGNGMDYSQLCAVRASQTTNSSRTVPNYGKKTVSYMKTLQSPIFDVVYAHSSSLDEELTANIRGDIVFVSLTFTLMIVYATFVTLTCDCMLDRQNLGRAGVIATGLGIVASFGLVSACGVEFVSIVGVMPFLILGIGIDDMFILLAGLAEVPLLATTPKQRTSGVSITITSLTDILAFGVGASSVFLGVRNFCIFTGVAVLFCYINFVTFFIACIAINDRRISANRHCLCCHPIEMKSDTTTASPLLRFCCGGTAPSSEIEMHFYYVEIWISS